ncbi:MAG: putative formate dehydrogenase [Acidimicrobiales bacterium]|nr:putative formate dehydrogenase [Acidimicrobiales bacterium]
MTALRSRSRGRQEADAVSGEVVTRFDRAERWLHWANATLVLTLIATGSIMYVDPLTALVGRRVLVNTIHLYAGIALPVPFMVVLVGRWNRGLRRDARRLGRFSPDDWRWLRKRSRATGSLRVGKFNAGQKVNAILVAGSLPVMLATGSLMKWHDPFSDSWRTGATFVHDLGYVGLFLLVVGHIRKALQDPVSMGAMRRGTPVSLRWAEAHHRGWHDEVVPTDDPPDGSDVG